MNSPESDAHAATLLDMPSGGRFMVEDLSGSPAERSRLYSLGILPGTVLEMRGRTGGDGSVRVRVRDSSLVLGAGMARCISCRAFGEGGAPDGEECATCCRGRD